MLPNVSFSLIARDNLNLKGLGYTNSFLFLVCRFFSIANFAILPPRNLWQITALKSEGSCSQRCRCVFIEEKRLPNSLTSEGELEMYSLRAFNIEVLRWKFLNMII